MAAPGICSGVWGFYLFCFNGIHWVDLLIQSPGSVLSPGGEAWAAEKPEKKEKRGKICQTAKRKGTKLSFSEIPAQDLIWEW